MNLAEALSSAPSIIKLLFDPRSVFRFRLRVQNGISLTEYILAACAGISSVLNLAVIVGLGRNFQGVPLILFILILGPLAGLAVMLFDGITLTFLGRIFDGTARVNEVAIVFAWSNVPRLLDLLLWLVLLLVLGPELLAYRIEVTDLIEPSHWNGILLAIVIGLGLWMYILWTIGLAEAHDYSLFSAIATLLLSRLLVGAMLITSILMLPVAFFWGGMLMMFLVTFVGAS